MGQDVMAAKERQRRAWDLEMLGYGRHARKARSRNAWWSLEIFFRR
jgi:hypothetical protein